MNQRTTIIIALGAIALALAAGFGIYQLGVRRGAVVVAAVPPAAG